MSGTIESNAIIIDDSAEKQEVMNLQQDAIQDATCFATCSSSSGCNEGDEASSSSTNMKDGETEGTGTISSVLRAGHTNVLLQCTCLGCCDFSIPNRPQNYHNLKWQYPILARKGTQVNLSNIAE